MSVSTQDPVSSDGFAILAAILNSPTLDALRASVDLLLSDHAERGGVRNVLRDPLVRSTAIGPMRDLVLPYLGQASFAVRAIVFDKTPTANWKVAWHQDVTIAVRDYRERPGWGPWSRTRNAPQQKRRTLGRLLERVHGAVWHRAVGLTGIQRVTGRVLTRRLTSR